MDVDLSIIIATYDRVASLRRLLESLGRFCSGSSLRVEVIVANNARDPEIAGQMENLAKGFAAGGECQFRHVREPQAGKCRAQNRAIAESKGSILAFLDDDVELTPDWLPAISAFFKNVDWAVMQGPILVPERMANDPKFLAVYHRLRTISFVKYRAGVKQLRTLTGGNMAMRREVFARVGLFDERLGPGRSGISEDVEFAQRLIKAGIRIGYEPKAAVYHEVDWDRLTEEFFRIRHEDQGRSRLLYKESSLFRIAPNLLRSLWTLGWYSITGNERKKYRAKGRYFHYRAMLVEKTGGGRRGRH